MERFAGMSTRHRARSVELRFFGGRRRRNRAATPKLDLCFLILEIEGLEMIGKQASRLSFYKNYRLLLFNPIFGRAGAFDGLLLV